MTPPKHWSDTFVAWVTYEPKRKPEPTMTGYQTLHVAPKPWPVILTDYDKATGQYKMQPFGIPLGDGWIIHAWAHLPNALEKIA